MPWTSCLKGKEEEEEILIFYVSIKIQTCVIYKYRKNYCCCVTKRNWCLHFTIKDYQYLLCDRKINMCITICVDVT